MVGPMMMIECSQLLAAGADGRWLGFDYALALFAATFPAWAMFTLVREWVRRPVPVTIAVVRRRRFQKRPGAAA